VLYNCFPWSLQSTQIYKYIYIQKNIDICKTADASFILTNLFIRIITQFIINILYDKQKSRKPRQPQLGLLYPLAIQLLHFTTNQPTNNQKPTKQIQPDTFRRLSHVAIAAPTRQSDLYATCAAPRHLSGDCGYSDNASKLWDCHKAAAISRGFPCPNAFWPTASGLRAVSEPLSLPCRLFEGWHFRSICHLLPSSPTFAMLNWKKNFDSECISRTCN